MLVSQEKPMTLKYNSNSEVLTVLFFFMVTGTNLEFHNIKNINNFQVLSKNPFKIWQYKRVNKDIS